MNKSNCVHLFLISLEIKSRFFLTFDDDAIGWGDHGQLMFVQEILGGGEGLPVGQLTDLDQHAAGV